MTPALPLENTGADHATCSSHNHLTRLGAQQTNTRREPKPVSTRLVLGRATPQHKAPDGACHRPRCDGVRRGRSDNNDSQVLRGKSTDRCHSSRCKFDSPRASSIPTHLTDHSLPLFAALAHRPIFQTEQPLQRCGGSFVRP